MKKLLIVPAALLMLLSAGCQSTLAFLQRAPSTATAPSSSRTYTQALDMAQSDAARDPSLRIVQVSDTGSMKPLLGENSLVLLEPAKVQNLRPGSLISFVIDGVEHLHRISDVAPDGVVTQGDANSESEHVRFDQITGCSIAIYYFDPSTLPSSSVDNKVPTAYASKASQIPSSTSLQIVGAQMLTEGDTAKVLLLDVGKYSVTLAHAQSVRLFVGAAGTPTSAASSVDLAWSADTPESTAMINDPSHPALGNFMLTIYDQQ